MINENIRFKKDQKYIIFDTETEGLNLAYHRPFQLSWIVCDNFKIIDTQNRYIWWEDLEISEGAKKITNFQYSSYKEKAEDPSNVYRDFSKHLLSDKVVNICQNILNFDCYIIKNLQKSINKKSDFSYLRRSVDTKCLFLAMQKGIVYNENDSFLEWQYKISNSPQKGLRSSQSYMLNYFSIKHDENKLHDALYDIKTLYEIFKNLSNKIAIPFL